MFGLIIFFISSVILCVYSFYGILTFVSSYRYIKKTSFSDIASCTEGLVCVQGKVKPILKDGLISPFSGKPCCYYRALLFLPTKGIKSIVLVIMGLNGTDYNEKIYSSEEPFIVDDGTNQCIIDTKEVTLTSKKFKFEPIALKNCKDIRANGALSLRELLICEGDTVSVTGYYQPRANAKLPTIIAPKNFTISDDAQSVIISTENKKELLKRYYFQLQTWGFLFVATLLTIMTFIVLTKAYLCSNIFSYII